MPYYSLLAELAASPAYALALFAFFLAVLHLTLVRWTTHDDIFWKKVDYVWLSVAAIGIVGASTQFNRSLALSYLTNGNSLPAKSSYTSLRTFLDGPLWVCTPRHKSEMSPPNFDAIVAEQQALCAEAKALASRLPVTLPSDIPTLEALGYKPIGATARYDRDFVNMLEVWAQMYRSHQREFAAATEASKQQGWELVLAAFTPLLLSAALALRITKVTGEIKLVRAKRAA